MRFGSAAKFTAIITAACLFAVPGCGSSKSAGLLSPSQSDSINSALGDIDSAVAAGDCLGTADASNHLHSIVSALPSSVDPTLRANLIDGADTVAARAATDCSKASTSTSSSTTTSTQPTTTSSTTSSTTTTTTSSTTEPTTQPTTTTTTDGGGGATPGGAGVGAGN